MDMRYYIARVVSHGVKGHAQDIVFYSNGEISLEELERSYDECDYYFPNVSQLIQIDEEAYKKLEAKKVSDEDYFLNSEGYVCHGQMGH